MLGVGTSGILERLIKVRATAEFADLRQRHRGQKLYGGFPQKIGRLKAFQRSFGMVRAAIQLRQGQRQAFDEPFINTQFTEHQQAPGITQGNSCLLCCIVCPLSSWDSSKSDFPICKRKSLPMLFPAVSAL